MNHLVLSLGAHQWTRQVHSDIMKRIVLWGYKQDPGDYKQEMDAVGGKAGY